MKWLHSVFVLSGLMTMMAANSAAYAEFTAVTGWDQQLFPAYIISTASLRVDTPSQDKNRLGDPFGLLGVEIKSPGKSTEVKVTIEGTDFLEKSVYSGVLAEKDVIYRIFPKVKYRYDRLAKCNQSMPASVSYRVQVGNQTDEEQTITFTVRSINDCPFAVKADQEEIDVGFTFAAYVNEQHPFVDKLLREALDRGIVDSFTGYQSKNQQDVLRQAYAIWDVLVARDVRYSNITASAAESKSVSSQHVRLIEDSLNNSQANCVDGSVLWVSMLRKIGIDGCLIFEPGHCYAGFYADEDRKVLYAIETTLLGESIESNDIKVPELVDKGIDEDIRDETSFNSFVSALQIATGKLASNAKKYHSNTDPQFQTIDIATARKQGVLPIPFQGTAEFIAYEHQAVGEGDEEEEDEE